MGRYRRVPKPLDTLSPAQAAQLLKVTPNVIAKWARAGQIETVKMGRLNRYPVEAIRKRLWADNQQAAAKKLIAIMELMVLSNNQDTLKEEASGRPLRAGKPGDQKLGDS